METSTKNDISKVNSMTYKNTEYEVFFFKVWFQLEEGAFRSEK